MKIIMMVLFVFAFTQNLKAEPELKAGELVPNSQAVSTQYSSDVDSSAKMVYIINKGPFNVVRALDESDKSKRDTILPQRIGRFRYESRKGIKLKGKVYSRRGFLGLIGWPFSTKLSERNQDIKGGSFIWIFEDGKEPILTQDLSILRKLAGK